ncbi:pseudouridine synthase [Maribacter sp. CXY002]|uniref:pseudouridine synthase n=1 Tax=Maribacter luteocoastalis TaxID=3407671 RepID=UPI003B66E788
MKTHSYYKLYKPFGMLSQLSSGEDKQLKKKKFLSELHPFPKGSMPIGRLDEKSEGLLLMTTNGKISDIINRSGLEKEYLVQLDGNITTDAITILENGVAIGLFGETYMTKPCKVFLLDHEPSLPKPSPKLRIGVHRPNSWIRIILKEGKFRQIRKMTAAVGFPTVRLVRIRIGQITIETLQERDVQELKDLIP